MAWCCTVELEPNTEGESAVVMLADELVALVGPEVAVAVQERISR